MNLDEYITHQEEKLCRDPQPQKPDESLAFHSALGRVAVSMFRNLYELDKPAYGFTPPGMLPFLP